MVKRRENVNRQFSKVPKIFLKMNSQRITNKLSSSLLQLPFMKKATRESTNDKSKKSRENTEQWSLKSKNDKYAFIYSSAFIFSFLY